MPSREKHTMVADKLSAPTQDEIWGRMTPAAWRRAVYEDADGFFQGLVSNYQDLLEDAVARVRKDNPSGRLVLIEVGTGTGDFLFNAKNMVDFAIGIDFNPEFIEYAQARRLEKPCDNLVFVHEDGRNLASVLNARAPAWIWEPDVTRVLASVGNTIGILDADTREAFFDQMIAVAGEQGFLMIGLWNAHDFPQAVERFYARNEKLCGKLNRQQIDYKRATLTTYSGYTTQWAYPEHVVADAKARKIEIQQLDTQFGGVTYLGKVADAQASNTSRAYYDSEDAFEFYRRVWGGENIHIGFWPHAIAYTSQYPGPEDVKDAAQGSMDNLLDHAGIQAGQKVVDLGSAYGGCVRHIARRFGAKAIGVDISVRECALARERNAELGFCEEQVEIRQVSFTHTGLADASVDVVVSHDSILHAGPEREQVIAEAARILKPHGRLVFSDPMQCEDADSEALRAVYDRIQLADMGSPAAYVRFGAKYGLVHTGYIDLLDSMSRHYQVIAHITEARRPELENFISSAYLDSMLAGLKAWQTAVNAGQLRYGIMIFEKQ
ncbi:Dimethylglycine N-methyltransferase [Porphyridium purpureum]|uniref:Dimethylglycine N-methyltransferase n=1 Tax=Porphyridium purpureum TaxID=35688 RepID=A0A5J4YL55_PORPP|nr:Dimethylglycine N-methyltransferase [Porphyridium purpureum]|eukprot:POR5376..scf249_10